MSDGDDQPPLKVVRDWWPIGIAIIGAVASAAVALYRIGEVEHKIVDQPLKVARLEDKVERLGCEIDNLKRIVKSQPEVFCH